MFHRQQVRWQHERGKKEFVYIVTHLKRKKETRGVCLFVALPDPYNLVNEAN